MNEQLDAEIAACADVVDAGGVVALPTRRWYMLCADSTNAVACHRIFQGKRRSRTKPLALVVRSNAEAAARFSMTAAAGRLADAFWPGDLALLLPWSRPEENRERWWLGESTAMVTRDPWLMGSLSARTRNPVATAVVSLSDADDPLDRRPALTSAEVRRFAARTRTPVEIIVEGGVCPLGVGLTVVDCTSSTAQLVREGAVHARAVAAALDMPAGSGTTAEAITT